MSSVWRNGELGQKLGWFMEGGALWHFTLLRLPFSWYNDRLGTLSTSLHFSTPSHFNFILIIHLISSIFVMQWHVAFATPYCTHNRQTFPTPSNVQ
ncbi:hypothetical protein M431DRAFT_203979 [Trichoderma harzianum CBS 226.95]|uniref:Uncharacterized protein n=1 Tax=Trichoderma harzianum CBS 226.95 TaxID=983964 RepID=A0A2T4AVN9_TRIHA|nr:hypothetical protein M431DRAFT_203979 [Trichoderma harzianum CBS 226.95]PTB61111.1 hypothetical protein M431DRAFT_203979 [Trichoderma harzianum CBS 226.95]